MMFSPPNLMSTISTTWPFVGEEGLCVFSIMSPVTQVALVEVNRASKKFMPSPSAVISGSMSSPVPERIRNRKEKDEQGGGVEPKPGQGAGPVRESQ